MCCVIQAGSLTSLWVRVLGPIQINSGWNVPVGPPGPPAGAVPPDQIRTRAARAVNQSMRRPARPRMRNSAGVLLSILTLCLSFCTGTVI